MARVRGRTQGTYLTDGATAYQTSVDSDRFIVAAFGWGVAIPGGPQMPRGFKPRHVSGLSAASGRRGIAVVPDVASDIWTGTATTFEVEADDGTVDTMTVKRRFGEKPSLP